MPDCCPDCLVFLPAAAGRYAASRKTLGFHA